MTCMRVWVKVCVWVREYVYVCVRGVRKRESACVCVWGGGPIMVGFNSRSRVCSSQLFVKGPTWPTTYWRQGRVPLTSAAVYTRLFFLHFTGYFLFSTLCGARSWWIHINRLTVSWLTWLASETALFLLWTRKLTSVCVHMYVCACVCVCVYVCRCAYVYVCMCACVWSVWRWSLSCKEFLNPGRGISWSNRGRKRRRLIVNCPLWRLSWWGDTGGWRRYLPSLQTASHRRT